MISVTGKLIIPYPADTTELFSLRSKKVDEIAQSICRIHIYNLPVSQNHWDTLCSLFLQKLSESTHFFEKAIKNHPPRQS
jgi:hypothetical protein